MRQALLLVAVLTAPLVAGCLAQQPAALTQTSATRGVDDLVHELGEIVEASIELADGLRIHGTVYIPDVAPGVKVPVILDMGPYYGGLNPETSEYSEENVPNRFYAHFLQRGYAIALVSLRGTGQSEGCFMIGGPQEEADVATVVEWLAAQEWSNGNVAMTGVSYDGTTPWEGLVSGAAPSLKAVIPVEGISDHYRYSFFEGVPIGGGASFNTYYQALVDVAYTSAANVPAWLPTQASHVCPEQAEVYLSPYQTYQDGVHSAFWDERDMSARLADSTAAVFVVHGTKDFNVKMDNVQFLWDSLPGPRRMLIGQWEHNIPWSNSYDPEQNWTQYNETMDQFLDAYLKGDPVALAAEQAAPPVLVQDSANRTWNLTAWPPVESATTAYGLGSDGALAQGPGAPGEATLAASPVAQVAVAGAAPAIGPLASQELAFETAAFPEDALFLGNPWIDLNVSVDQARGSLEARLYEVDAEGERELVSLGWQNLATRTSRDESEPVPTGETMPIRILMEGIAQRVEKGNMLVLVLSGESTSTLTPHVQATTFTFTLGGEDARLWLPVFSGTSRGAGAHT